jgi:hypothetical protein
VIVFFVWLCLSCGFRLWTWLGSESVVYREVTTWYTLWKAVFPARVREWPGVREGFKVGLGLLRIRAVRGKGASLGPLPTFVPLALREGGVVEDEDGEGAWKKRKKPSVGLPELRRKMVWF